MNKKLIVITGPTASGKSALAVSLAKRLNTEIINCDSRQIYKGIPIVTAVPTPEERMGIRHHLLERLPLDSYYSAAKFQSDSNALLIQILKDSDYAIVCGGSMMYIDTLLNGIDNLPDVPDEIRSGLTKEWMENGNDWLLDQLLKLDPSYYNKVDKANFKRVFHAIEITLTAGVPYSSLLTGKDRRTSENLLTLNSENNSLKCNVIKISLSGIREKLFERINSRVIRMVEQGLEEEAQKVYPLRHLNSLNTVGLKEMFDWFEGKMKFDEVISRIQKNTRVYAKKQMTWHKRDNNLHYLDFSDSMSENVEKTLNLIGNSFDLLNKK